MLPPVPLRSSTNPAGDEDRYADLSDVTSNTGSQDGAPSTSAGNFSPSSSVSDRLLPSDGEAGTDWMAQDKEGEMMDDRLGDGVGARSVACELVAGAADLSPLSLAVPRRPHSLSP